MAINATGIRSRHFFFGHARWHGLYTFVCTQRRARRKKNDNGSEHPEKGSNPKFFVASVLHAQSINIEVSNP
jgi:hypothetical protein